MRHEETKLFTKPGMHVVSVLASDRKRVLVSFKHKFDGDMCMWQSPIYSTWSIEPESESCHCADFFEKVNENDG